MGNCLRNNKISAQDHESNVTTPVEPSDEAKVEQIKASSLSKLEAPVGQQQEQGTRKKKVVRLKIQNDDEGERGHHHSNSKSTGAVRIRVVMTQEELKRMLMCKNDVQNTSLEQLLSAIKLRGGRISDVGEYNGGMNSWRPALESIPEDGLIFNSPSM